MDYLPPSEAAACERLRVKMSEAVGVTHTNAPRALRDNAAMTVRLLTAAVALIEEPFTDEE